MFEKAVRKKLRFDYKGKSSIEDLWDLPPGELDGIYTKLRTQQNATKADSLMAKSSINTKLQLQIDLVKHIFGVKEAEEGAKKTRADNKLRKEKIATILAEKKDDSLRGMSEDQLQKALDDLN